MRRTYISPEFTYQPIYGSYNLLEQASFFGSKMIEIEDLISLTNESLFYYQQSNNEQLDLESELTLTPGIYDQVSDKRDNHTLTLLDIQSDYQKRNNASWELTIDLDLILSNCVFGLLKKYRTFEGMKNEMTFNGDINTSIRKYIDLNIRSRYKLQKVDMYIDYINLLSVNGIRYSNRFDQNIAIESKRFTKFQQATEFDGSQVKISFNQEKPANLYAFKYYFNLFFEKI